MNLDNRSSDLDADEDEDFLVILYFNRMAAAIVCSQLSVVPRLPSMLNQRLHWEDFRMKFGDRQDFQRHLRMSYGSFTKLLELIRPQLEVNNNMAHKRGGSYCQKLGSTLRCAFAPAVRIPIS